MRVQFHLRNPTDEQIAFKVKCIDPKRYHVRPASGTVEAANSAMIMLELRPIPEAELADFLNSLQAFLIQTVIPRDGETSDIKEIVSLGFKCNLKWAYYFVFFRFSSETHCLAILDSPPFVVYLMTRPLKVMKQSRHLMMKIPSKTNDQKSLSHLWE